MRQLIRDRYEQLELLGHGGQGRVVRALDHLHSRTVALKLRPAGRETERDMLLREAGLLLAVPPHPNLPLVREDFFDEDVYCLVMDWVVGDNLSVVLASRGDPGLDPHHVVEWLGEIASALDHLHAHGVVHGDVKPSNCILGPDGQVVLVDLGVGTRDGSVAVRYSSRRYLAPEVAAGQPPTPASDIFGLSILAYMLLTGEVPDPTRPGTVPSALEAPLRRGLSIDPATRPASASELVGRLGHTGRQSTPRSMPAGRISFLFTDVEGSTQMLQEHGGKFDALIERHHQIVRRGIARHGGSEVAVRGDGFVVAFRSANDALEAALEMQRELPDPDAPPGEQVRVRMGLHVGEARSTEAGYVGIALNRASRVADAAFGGQVLLTQDFLDELAPPLPTGAGFKDLGQHRLRDLGEPERLFQLTSDHLQADFPPPRAQVARDRSLPGVPRGEGAEGEPASSQPPGNLRKPLTSFVGREQELEKLEALLGSHRLVTVTGPGGAGKTRVATEVVRRLQGLFPDGTWVVELGSLTEPELVAHQTARTLEVADSPGLDVVEAIRAQIGSARMLVVLDNCEHVLDAAALVAAGLLESCPNLQVLATSRQRLDVLGEKVYQLPPLGLPAPGAAPADTAASDAVALFADRARLVYESFELDASSASEVAEICRHLDGLPLAIELAAAHADSLTPSEIGERLADRFAFLSRGNRAAPERQQGLRAVLDWGWELLDEAERDLLSGLSVFAGGWTLESAQEVTGAGPGLPARLARLAARSFVNVTSEGQTSRYGLLETVRLYAWDRLHAAGSAPGLVQAHARWSVRLAEQAAGGIRGPDVAPWLERMETEHDNFRAALRRCLQGDVGTAVELAGWLSFFWERRGHVTEGTAWLQEVLAAAPGDATAELARALSGAAYLAEAEGEYHRAQSLNQSALDVYRSLQDRPGQCQSLSDLGNVLRALRDMAGAETAHAESLQLARDLGDDYAIQRSLTNLANVWLDSGDLQRARVAYEEALPVAERIGNVVGAVGLRNNLAQIVGELGDWEAARALAAETMRAARATGDVMALLIAISAGEVDAMRRGEFQEARKLLEEGLELARGANVRLHVGACLHDLGVIEAREGNPEESAARYREAWQIFRDIGADARAIASLGNLFQLTVERGDMRQAADMAREALGLQSGAEAHLLARPLEMAATVASLAGEDEAAAGLFAASAAVASAAPVSTESSPSTERAAQRERMIESLRKRMGSGFAVAWDRGEAMDRERAMEVAASVTQLP